MGEEHYRDVGGALERCGRGTRDVGGACKNERSNSVSR